MRPDTGGHVTMDRSEKRVTGATIRLEGLTKRFGDVTAVDNVSLEIEKGQFVTLLGPSGSGKTTILNMIAGFEEPTGGDIYVNDRSVGYTPPFKRDIGMVFQNYALFPHMTVFENIAFPLTNISAAKPSWSPPVMLSASW